MEEGRGLWKTIESFLVGFGLIYLAMMGWDWYKEYTNKPKFYSSENLSSYTSARRKGWVLWTFSTDKPNTEFETFRQRGLSTKHQCMSEGMARTREAGSYQCGNNCYTSESTLKGTDPVSVEVCELICDADGCRK